MTLTVTEKEHWKTRIESRIDRRIKTIVADTHPTYLEDIKSRARSAALKELALDKLTERKKALREQDQNIQRELTVVNRQMAAVVLGRTEDELAGRNEYQLSSITDKAIADKADLLEARLMSEDELGRSVLKLRNEREELLDTVWLATSPRQIRDLWKDVSELLGEQPTELQQCALSTPPAESSGS